MDKQFRDRFRQFVSAHPFFTDDPDGFGTALQDSLAEEPQAVFLVLSALEEKVPQALQAASHVPEALILQQCARRLMEHRAMEAGAAQWAVSCWAFALGRGEALAGFRPEEPENTPEAEDPFGPEAPPAPPRASRPLVLPAPLPQECLHCDATLPPAARLNRCPHCGKPPDAFAGVPPSLSARLDAGEKIIWLARPIRGPFFLIALFPGIFGAGFTLFDLVFLISASRDGLNLSELLIFLLWGVIPGLIWAFIWLLYRSFPHVWYALTPRRFLIQHGSGGEELTEIPLDKIRAIQLEVGLFEQLFRSGSIKIDAGGEAASREGSVRLSYHYLSALPRPWENYRRLRRLIARYTDLQLPEQVA